MSNLKEALIKDFLFLHGDKKNTVRSTNLLRMNVRVMKLM